MKRERKVTIAPGTKLFLAGIGAGLLTNLVLGLPLQIWFAVGLVAFFFYGVSCVINPRVQRFAYLLVGIFIGAAISFVISFSFFDWSLVKLNFLN